MSLDRLIDLVEPSFEQWGYLIVFAARLLENSAFVGAVIPGDVVLLLAGFYAERGALDLPPIVGLSFIGGLMGDMVGYWIGRVFGRRIADRWGSKVGLSEERLARFDRYFAEYGMWAVALGRIAPVVRTVNTVAAGMAKMSAWSFAVAAAVAGLAWSIVVPVLGFAFSGSLDAVRSTLGWAGGLVVLVFAGVLYWTYRRMVARLERSDP